MPIRPAQFDEAARALEPVLENLPPKVIAIDGRSGIGKTTLGRFLAWYFNASLLELDLFLANDRSEFRTEEVHRIIKQRMACRSPILVEGVTVLKVLAGLSVKPDFVVYVRNLRHPRGFGFGELLDEYERTYQPQELANHIVEFENDG